MSWTAASIELLILIVLPSNNKGACSAALDFGGVAKGAPKVAALDLALALGVEVLEMLLPDFPQSVCFRVAGVLAHGHGSMAWPMRPHGREA